MIRVIVRLDAEGAAAAAAEIMADAIAARCASGEPSHLALAGGTTPRRAYEMLAGRVRDWTGVHLWLADERRAAADDPEANVRMVRESLLTEGGAGTHQLHAVRWELGDEGARDAYAALLEELVPAGPTGLPVLDVAFLGLGEDGHTASLFPADDALDAVDAVCVLVRSAPKPPPVRLTMTLPVLAAARERVVLATGAAKAEAVAATLGNPTRQVPASLLPRTNTTLVLDATAATLLTPEVTGA